MLQPSNRECITIARQHAYVHGHNVDDAPDYLPTNPIERSQFIPHQWVLDAIKDAYNKGRLSVTK